MENYNLSIQDLTKSFKIGGMIFGTNIVAVDPVSYTHLLQAGKAADCLRTPEKTGGAQDILRQAGKSPLLSGLDFPCPCKAPLYG